MISRQRVLRDRDTTPVAGHGDHAPWAADDFVVPAAPAVGRYGDEVWVFPPDRGSGRPTRIEFDDGLMFATDDWRDVARDLAMALLGHRPGRAELARSRHKPITVAKAVRRIALLGRWAEATGHSLPALWTPATVDAFVSAYHASRLPNRVDEANPKSIAGTRQTLAAYLNLIAALHEHRHHLRHGMPVPPWANWPSIGAHHVAGVVDDAEGRTAIIEPDAWWAAVRSALRVLNEWADDVTRAWNAFHLAEASRRGSAGRADINAWASDPRSQLPVDAEGRPSWNTVAAWTGIAHLRGDQQGLRLLANRMIGKGRVTRCWWPDPATTDDDPSPSWLGHMDTHDLFTFASVVRNAALVVLAALSAMRESELQELRSGCVEFHDGCWALRSTVQKHQRQAAPGLWWVTSVAVGAIRVLEDLARPIKVFTIDPTTGDRVRSDHLVCTLGRGNYGRAGLAGGTKGFERFTAWVDDHAEEFGLDPIGAAITAHQFRRTFAVIAAWQPDGHVAVELQLKDTADVAAGYYANHDRKWFEAYELAKAEALAERVRSYVVDDTAPALAGPAGACFAAHVLEAHNLANNTALGPVATIDAHEQAATAIADRHACGDGWDCAGDRRQARCLAVHAAQHPETSIGPPQLSSGLCLDLGDDDDRACPNVILDPPAHLAF